MKGTGTIGEKMMAVHHLAESAATISEFLCILEIARPDRISRG
jgi:hypothetical protein